MGEVDVFLSSLWCCLDFSCSTGITSLLSYSLVNANWISVVSFLFIVVPFKGRTNMLIQFVILFQIVCEDCQNPNGITFVQL